MTDNQNDISILIVPFENLAEGREMSIFCKSIYLDLVTELSRFRQFQVLTHPDTVQAATHAVIADRELLDPDFIIQGSFRTAAGTVRINAQLFEAKTNRLIWANRFEKKNDDILQLQEDLCVAVVASLQHQLNLELLSQLRKKSLPELKAYECWLYGNEELKKGTLEADLKARDYFQQAIHIAPDYSLAYSGMSLTYFNEWSCRLWDRWEISQTGAFEWAQKAMELDDNNYMAAYIVGRIFLYEGMYETAEHYLRKSLQLNSNDPDNLIGISSCLVYLGYPEEAYGLYKKAVHLNPVQTEWYYPIGGLALFEMGEYEQAAAMNIKVKKARWVDGPAIYAAVYYHLNDKENMYKCWEQYKRNYVEFINHGKDATDEEALQWLMNVNPHKLKSNYEPFFEFIAGAETLRPAASQHNGNKTPGINSFVQKDAVWDLSFAGEKAQVPDLKGFIDLKRLLQHPGQPVHCAELAGNVLQADGENLLDEKAKKQYHKKIKELQQDITIAEEQHNYIKLEQLQTEYDAILDHLSQSLGIKGKSRKSGDTIEKSRSAVTWRIRTAIAKIEKILPTLGKHLSNSVKTGTFCSYQPEKPVKWQLD